MPIIGGILGSIFILIVIGASCVGCPYYRVWDQQMEGEAELQKAIYAKQVAVQEAKAKYDSSEMLADADVKKAKGWAAAEIEKAKGVSQANKIIGDSLKGNEDYLRYLWIHSLSEGKNEVIYVPTEANLPILEANRAANKK